MKEQVRIKSVLLLIWGWTGLDACCEMIEVKEWVRLVCDDEFLFGGCYLMRIFSQGVAAAWLSQLLLEEEKAHGFGF